MLGAAMEPVAPRSFPPVEAGAVLAVVTAIVIAAGALIGWAAGSFTYGLIVGIVLGLPAGVLFVYQRYRGTL